MSILDGFTLDEINGLLKENPTLRGYIQGYLAEYKLRQQLLTMPGITAATKIPDASPEKGDILVMYKDTPITIEVKSIATSSVREDILNDTWQGTVVVKNTDSRDIEIEGLGVISSTSLKKGQFDILAISCYAVSGQWDFVFMENRFLPEKSIQMPGFIKTKFVVNPATTPCIETNCLKILDELYERVKDCRAKIPTYFE